MRRLLAFVAAALSFETTLAQEAVSAEVQPRVNGSAVVGVTDKYIYHGYILEDQGAIVQPEFEVLARFYSGEGFVTNASWRLYVFSSFQSHESREEKVDAMMHAWYEVQVETGFVLELARHFTLSVSYVRFESPNHAFMAANAAELVLRLDDSEWLGAWALHPHVSWFRPFPGGWEASDEGSYFELGIEPERSVGKGKRPVKIGFPVTLGLGQKRYYLGEHFGFFSVGVSMNLPVTFIPASWGEWNLGVSGTYYRLGRNAALVANGGERNESVLALTLGTDF